jgi:hypothetical protein
VTLDNLRRSQASESAPMARAPERFIFHFTPTA